jgi:hypothetical protein
MRMLEQPGPRWSYDPDMRGLRALWDWRLFTWLGLMIAAPLVMVALPPLTDPSCPPILLQMQHGPRPPRCESAAGQAWLGLAIHTPVIVLAIAVAIELGVRTAVRRIDRRRPGCIPVDEPAATGPRRCSPPPRSRPAR